MTNHKTLHIVSFDVPYPPNYGGVIDVYYKIKNLAELGVHIYLHTYEYGRGEQKELEIYCKKVFYYPRSNAVKNFLSRIPFIVKTRSSETLLKNLSKDMHPILFEGLHTTYPLIKGCFDNRKILVRTHNIEHEYYKGLQKSESSKRKKIFFETEAKKLKKYEDILKKADHILSISPFEQSYFQKKYGAKANYIPAFFCHKRNVSKSPSNKFTLWHGDLRISDNCKAALFTIAVFSKLKHKLVLASSFETEEIAKEVEKHDHITFDNLQREGQLDHLLQTAHIHSMVTYQKTGIKLKLLNALYKGKFVIGNTKKLEDTGLEEACCLANTKEEFRKHNETLLLKDFEEEDLALRTRVLEKFNPIESAKKITALLSF